MKSFTIKTFFPTGDPSGLRVSFVRGLPIKAFFIPRNYIKIFKNHYKKYASLEAMYMLFNTDNIHNLDEKNEVYIGKTTNILDRMTNHKEDKENWWDIEVAFTITDSTDPLEEGTTSYLEYLMCKTAQHSSLFKLKGNVQHPHKQSLSESDQSYGNLLFNNINILSKSLGFDVFLNVNYNTKGDDKSLHIPTFIITRNGSRAYARYTDKGLLILKGSRSCTRAHLRNFNINHYKSWLGKYMIKDGNQFVFTKNKLCRYPSEGSNIVLKSPSDGWREWHKRDDPKVSLSDYYR